MTRRRICNECGARALWAVIAVEPLDGDLARFAEDMASSCDRHLLDVLEDCYANDAGARTVVESLHDATVPA